MRILLAHTDNAQGRAALEVAAQQARAFSGSVTVLVHRAAPPTRLAAEQHRDDRLEQALEAATDQLRAAGVTADPWLSTSEAASGDAILDAAETVKADLIIIGMRRRSAVGKLIMGSAAQTILLNANCPVLAVKAPE